MRIKTKLIIIVSLIIAVMVLMVGCTPTRKKCDLDSDCGGDYCSENLQKVTISTCVEGRCQEVTAECNESEICVADSLGVRCVTKDPDTNKPRMSCSENSDTLNLLGINAFNPTYYVCGADCPADSYCSEDCYCEDKVEISCSGNTDDTILNGENIFDQRIEMCADDCPGGYDCNAQCVCEERPRNPCPDPVFTTNYFRNAPPVDYDFVTLADMWLDDPGSLLDLGDTINITAYEHVDYSNGVSYFIPFPEVQLTRIPNTENLAQYGAYCVNDYYEGPVSLDINLNWLSRPEVACIWGGAEGFEGVLTVCPEDVINWFNAVLEKAGFLPF